MKSNLTELVFILDRSGSMGGLENDTIGGFNSLLKKQTHEAGDVIVTTVLFDNHTELLHDRINIKGIAPLTAKDYFVRGSTALLDAMGKTITKIQTAHQHTLPEQRPNRVLCVIITDGEENSSSTFTHEQIKTLVESTRNQENFEYLFLGANIDAFAEARKYGIQEELTMQYETTGEDVSLNYDCIAKAATSIRETGKVSGKWKAK